MQEVEVKLLELMAKQNMRTIKEIHEKSGLSRKAISKLLKGEKTGLRLDTISKLCKALDCEIGDLIVFKE